MAVARVLRAAQHNFREKFRTPPGLGLSRFGKGIAQPALSGRRPGVGGMILSDALRITTVIRPRRVILELAYCRNRIADGLRAVAIMASSTTGASYRNQGR
jgi:hypothetical protein